MHNLVRFKLTMQCLLIHMSLDNFLIYGLMTLSFTQNMNSWIMGWKQTVNWRRHGQTRTWSHFRYYLWICLDRLRKYTQILGRDSRCLSEDVQCQQQRYCWSQLNQFSTKHSITTRSVCTGISCRVFWKKDNINISDGTDTSFFMDNSSKFCCLFIKLYDFIFERTVSLISQILILKSLICLTAHEKLCSFVAQRRMRRWRFICKSSFEYWSTCVHITHTKHVFKYTRQK
jgi:hypothetical protein